MNTQNTSFNWGKTYLLTVFILLLNHTIMAQKIITNDIIGVYSLPNSNPEGGQTIAVFPDNTFVSVYFGGLIKGTWKIQETSVYFTTDVEPKIVLYGRKLEFLKDTIQLDFSGEFNQRTKVNLNMETGDTMQHVFNDGANCKDYPYIYKTKKGLKKVSFAINDGIRDRETGKSENFDIFTFSIPDTYNDIIAVNLPREYTTKKIFSVNYLNGGLCFNSDAKPTSKRSIESISEEDRSFYKKYSKKLLPNILNYGNEVFPYIENPTKETLQPFYSIQPTRIKKVKEIDIKITNGSLYTATCN